jgi:ABC-type polysaccharide/polyol phosphate transport system ATPase subunit
MLKSLKLSEPAAAAIPVIECRDVTKRFYFYEHRTASLRELFVRTLQRRPAHIRRPEFTLRGLTMSVGRGESVALIGPNGSGKSTVLRLLAGIYAPSEGSVAVRGRVAAVIELGAGFQPELTGKENVQLYGAVMGLSRAEIDARYPEIVAFAGIERFMEMPVKYYSSGMQARLAFAVTACIQSDILLLDEVLAVGDQAFRQRCLDRLRLFHQRGGTLVVTSHDLDLIREVCSRAVWLEGGAVRMQGDIEEVVAAYQTNGNGHR